MARGCAACSGGSSAPIVPIVPVGGSTSSGSGRGLLSLLLPGLTIFSSLLGGAASNGTSDRTTFQYAFIILVLYLAYRQSRASGDSGLGSILNLATQLM